MMESYNEAYRSRCIKWRATTMREKTLESKLVQTIKAMGGIAPKLTSPGFDGMPDRLVLLAGGRMAFVEVKAHGMKPRPLQIRRHGMLRRLGFKVYVLDDVGQIQPILSEITGGCEAQWRQKTE